MTLEYPHPQSVTPVTAYDLVHGQNIPGRLRHLSLGEADHAVVGPGADEGKLRVGAAALGQLVLVVRKAEVRAAAVDVGAAGQVLADHRRALQVPAGTPRSPRALPRGLAGLRGFPQGEVQRAALGLCHAGLDTTGQSLRLAHLVGALLAESPVLRVALHGEVDVAVARSIGVAAFGKLLDERDHLRNVSGRAGLDIGKRDAHEIQGGVEGVGVSGDDLLPGDALPGSAVDDLVLDVGDVLDVAHGVAATAQIPHHGVPEDRGPGVADVDVVVDGRAADVEPDAPVAPDLGPLAAQCVAYPNAHARSLACLACSILRRASSAPSTATG